MHGAPGLLAAPEDPQTPTDLLSRVSTAIAASALSSVRNVLASGDLQEGEHRDVFAVQCWRVEERAAGLPLLGLGAEILEP